MAGSYPYYKRYPGDYLRDTTHLSFIEHGAFNLMLDIYCSTREPLSADNRTLYRSLGAITQAEQDAVQRVLGEFWVMKDGGWINERADKEIGEANKVSKRQRDRAIERWEKEKQMKQDRLMVNEEEDIDTQIVRVWNEMAEGAGLRKARPNAERLKPAKDRLKERNAGIQMWRYACEIVAKSPFLCGGGERNWKCHFDWLAKKSNFSKVVEGVYDQKESGDKNESSAERATRRSREFAERSKNR